MTRQNQIIAVEAGVKEDAGKALTGAARMLAADEAALYGLTRTYEPRGEVEGVRLETRPDERVRVQVVAGDVLEALAVPLARLFDVTLTKEAADTEARADLRVPDGSGAYDVLLTDVPVTYLLFLEKQVKRIKEVLAGLPVLDPSVDWHVDPNTGLQRTDPVVKTSGKKVPRNHVKWEPPNSDYTQPAQVDVWQEDVIVGDWTTVRFSGAVPGTRKAELIDRCDRLLRAVLAAREEANSIAVTDRQGKPVLDWLLR
jgi:hypothetical protein